jgi:hypothetical protein
MPKNKKEYGNPVKPSVQAEKLLEEVSDHLNWSKSDAISWLIATAYQQAMDMPRAIRPDDALNQD